jgi:hypothetical protein
MQNFETALMSPFGDFGDKRDKRDKCDFANLRNLRREFLPHFACSSRVIATNAANPATAKDTHLSQIVYDQSSVKGGFPTNSTIPTTPKLDRAALVAVAKTVGSRQNGFGHWIV